MTDSNNQTQKVPLLQKATSEFNENLINKFNEIDQLWKKIVDTPEDYELQKNFKRLVQNIGDKSGIFSVPKIKGYALEIEKILSYPLWSVGAEQNLQIEKIGSYLSQIGQACRDAISVEQDDFTPEMYGWRSKNRLDELVIVIVEDDAEFVNGVRAKLRKNDMRVKHITSIDDLGEILNTMEPATIIVNNEMAQLSKVPFEVLVSQSGQVPPPIIMISDTDDMQKRFDTLRSGASFFLPKAAGPERIVMALNSVLETKKTGELKVMIVGESRSLAEYIAMVFHNIGSRVAIVAKPMEMLPPMRRFRPDVLLIDLRMSMCSGFELQRIIRQELGFSQTPIMFLSSDSVDISLAYERNLDITNFIPLPTSQVRLVRAVLNAIKISKKKILNTNTDAFSGHLNHEAFLEKIEMELVRCKRSKNNFCIALIELDQPSSSGNKGTVDEVALKGLSDVMGKSLRTSDFIGRLDEGLFGTLLVDSDTDGAMVAVNKTREMWHKLQNENPDLQEYKSISAGIAMYPAYNKARALLRGAQASLDSAKLSGGGSTMIALK
ncbi:MAG: response regulator [Magnetococcales bacterium]|nr:response regulator [Magnetococcales bacterium]